MSVPTIFISYSHDSPEHAAHVLKFANRLVEEGVDVILDQYESSPSEGWPRWMDKHIRTADFIFMVCTEIYFRRVMGEENLGMGLGVKWEGNLIYQHIYNIDTTNTRFIPVLFDYSKIEHIPTPLQGVTHYRIDTKNGYEDLYRRITNQPRVKKPNLGKLRSLPLITTKPSVQHKITDVSLRPTVFIGYSHKDGDWKELVVAHLRVLRKHSQIELWDDRQIGDSQDWHQQIIGAINRANIAILLISANFLSSEFVVDEEVPLLLERYKNNDLQFIPIIIRPCAWRLVEWLKDTQLYPKDFTPLSAGSQHLIDENLTVVAETIYETLNKVREKEHPPAIEKVLGRAKVDEVPVKVSLAKLPITDTYVVGREMELKNLDSAWGNKDVNIVSLVAWGGVGKTALVNKWLSQMEKDNYRGAECIYGWSFYSQGTAEGRQVSADQFITASLKWFGDQNPMLGSSWDKGERLASLIRKQRTLLILDGLEPLQNPSPVEAGKIRDSGLTSLLRELAQQNPGLVIITTRLPVDDLKDYKEKSTIEINLENLSPEAGAAVLERFSVNGTNDELKDVSMDFGGHALALTLMGRYLQVAYDGDINKRIEFSRVSDAQRQGAHARRVLESYESWLKGTPELDILRLMGLFDRPAEKGALDSLRTKPAIEGLTDNLQKLSDSDWQVVVENLRDLRLLSDPGVSMRETLDCHPLLREHFGERLKTENLKAWRNAHRRLYEYYKNSTKEFPETLDEMAPLLAAVMHGCQAGAHQEVLVGLYWQRVSRGTEFFITRKLGAFGADLSALSGFFDLPWRRPMPTLSENWKSFILSTASFDLRAMGQLGEAVYPMQAALDTTIEQQNWINAAQGASNLSALFITIGDVIKALKYSSQSVELADRSEDMVLRMTNRARMANVLHQAGQIIEAKELFSEAEEIQKLNEPDFPLLYSVSGFQYCDLLLNQGEYHDVQNRASQTLVWANQYLGLLDVALDNLSIGRAGLIESQLKPNQQSTEFESFLNRAVDGLRQAGYQDDLPRGLLTRVEFNRAKNQFDKAQRDLDEVFTIATRGGMGLYLADCHLEYARLYLAKGEKVKAHEHWQIAKDSIEKMGYHRRDKEVQELEEQLK